MKHSYLLQAFLYALLTIFLLLIQEIHYSDMYPNVLSLYFAVLTTLILILWLLNLRSFYKFTVMINKDAIIQETDRLQLEESRKLIQTLSSQRHDFKNQLQVIRMLAQMNKNQEIVKYILECNTAMDLSNSIYIHIDNSVISAMLLVYFSEAKEKGIGFFVDCDVDFANFNLPTVAVTRIVGNIIRNAIEVLENTPAPERVIQITIWEAGDSYNFVVWNNGPALSGEMKEKIFMPGFSTKNSTGLGLTIVQQMVEELSGRIILQSSPESGTEFKIVIPKKVPAVTLPEQPGKVQEVVYNSN